MSFQSTKLIELGSCAFRQWNATHSHCRFLHGYQLKAKFYFGATSLDSNNWVVDFGGLKELKQILNNQFDHTLCVAANDPHLRIFKLLHENGACDLRIMNEGVGIENTAEWCFNTAENYIQSTYNGRCWVEKVEVFEHENNSAVFFGPANVKTAAALIHEALVTATDMRPNIIETTSEAIEPQQSAPEQPSVANIQPVPLRGNVTSGYSGLFDNISWGSGR